MDDDIKNNKDNNKDNNDNNKNKNLIFATFLAILAAALYALSTPFSKLLLREIPPTLMASFLYVGAGLGVSIMYLFNYKNEKEEDRLKKGDLPYIIGMLILDTIAPIILMIGIKIGNASNVSLLSNFEIVATTIIALIFFKEKISGTLWGAIILIVISSCLLSLEGGESFKFSYGSLLVIGATVCWGLENNITRSISEKSIYQIVIIKCFGIAAGCSFIGFVIAGEKFPKNVFYICGILVLGYIAYGLSIFIYIRAQRDLGASKVSAYYAVAPFIGTALAFLINGDKITMFYLIALPIMIIGTILVVVDTLSKKETDTDNEDKNEVELVEKDKDKVEES